MVAGDAALGGTLGDRNRQFLMNPHEGTAEFADSHPEQAGCKSAYRGNFDNMMAFSAHIRWTFFYSQRSWSG